MITVAAIRIGVQNGLAVATSVGHRWRAHSRPFEVPADELGIEVDSEGLQNAR